MSNQNIPELVEYRDLKKKIDEIFNGHELKLGEKDDVKIASSNLVSRFAELGKNLLARIDEIDELTPDEKLDIKNRWQNVSSDNN